MKMKRDKNPFWDEVKARWTWIRFYYFPLGRYFHNIWHCWSCGLWVLPGQEWVTFIDAWCGRFCMRCHEEIDPS